MESGLRPFPDPLNPNYSATISVTKDPMYALLYGLLYSEKGTSSKYGINRQKEWARILWRIMKVAKPFALKKYMAKRKDKRLVTLKDARRWTISFNDSDYNHFM